MTNQSPPKKNNNALQWFPKKNKSHRKTYVFLGRGDVMKNWSDGITLALFVNLLFLDSKIRKNALKKLWMPKRHSLQNILKKRFQKYQKTIKLWLFGIWRRFWLFIWQNSADFFWVGNQCCMTQTKTNKGKCTICSVQKKLSLDRLLNTKHLCFNAPVLLFSVIHISCSICWYAALEDHQYLFSGWGGWGHSPILCWILLGESGPGLMQNWIFVTV